MFQSKASTRLSLRHRAQTSLRLFGEAGENHGDVITGMFVAGARDYHSGAIDFAVVFGGLQSDRHFRPRRKRRGAAEFDSAFVDDDRAGRENQPRLSRFDGDMLLEGSGFNFSRAHTGGLTVAQQPTASNSLY
jgi:hypothetical protein